MLGVVTYTSAKSRASWPPFRFASDDDLGVQSVNLWGPLRTSYWRACATRGATTLSLEGSRSPRLASSARARQPPCQAVSDSLGENSSMTDPTTSSPSSFKQHGRFILLMMLQLHTWDDLHASGVQPGSGPWHSRALSVSSYNKIT